MSLLCVLIGACQVLSFFSSFCLTIITRSLSTRILSRLSTVTYRLPSWVTIRLPLCFPNHLRLSLNHYFLFHYFILFFSSSSFIFFKRYWLLDQPFFDFYHMTPMNVGLQNYKTIYIYNIIIMKISYSVFYCEPMIQLPPQLTYFSIGMNILA